MKRIILPDTVSPTVPFYLSVEEWAARCLPEGEYIFAWQVPPSVICGRHQDIPLEVNLAEADRLGVEVWRRKSGGGAVLADMNNVMFSYIAPATSVQAAFTDYTSRIRSMLRSLGLEASATGRNDIAINGRKVAGNAFYRLPGKVIVHGTMLLDTDTELMSRLLTPSKAKRASKGVVSMPSRITTLRSEGLGMKADKFIDRALAYLCPAADESVEIKNDDLALIQNLMQTYTDPFFRRSEPAEKRIVCDTIYFDGVGQLQFSFSLNEDGLVSEASLEGDYFPLRDIDEAIIAPLIGSRYSKHAFEQRLLAVNADSAIVGCNTDQLLKAMFNLQKININS